VYTLDEPDTLAMARKGAQYLPMSSDGRYLAQTVQGVVERIRTELDADD
jgi:hypothetical protein